MSTNDEGLPDTEGKSRKKSKRMRSRTAHTGATARTPTSESIRRFREANLQVLKGPVPLEIHYGILKGVEKRLREYLAGLDHEYDITGLRVAYDLFDSSNEPNVLPYAVEFGDLTALDKATAGSDDEKEVESEELQKLLDDSPISLDLLNELFASTSDELQIASKDMLRTGVFVELKGSPRSQWAAWCGCKRNRVKYCYYNSRGKRVFCNLCTRTDCNSVR